MTYMPAAIIAISRHHIKLHAAVAELGHAHTETINSSSLGMLGSLPGTGVDGYTSVRTLDWKLQLVAAISLALFDGKLIW